MKLSVYGRYERSKTSIIFRCYVNIFSHMADAGRTKAGKRRRMEGGQQECSAGDRPDTATPLQQDRNGGQAGGAGRGEDGDARSIRYAVRAMTGYRGAA